LTLILPNLSSTRLTGGAKIRFHPSVNLCIPSKRETASLICLSNMMENPVSQVPELSPAPFKVKS
jgi:hypothetical protein